MGMVLGLGLRWGCGQGLGLGLEELREHVSQPHAVVWARSHQVARPGRRFVYLPLPLLPAKASDRIGGSGVECSGYGQCADATGGVVVGSSMAAAANCAYT